MFTLEENEKLALEAILERWSDSVAQKVIRHLESYHEKPTYLMSTEEAARTLNVCPSTLTYFKSKYKLTVQKITGSNWYQPEEIRALADRRWAEKVAASESGNTVSDVLDDEVTEDMEVEDNISSVPETYEGCEPDAGEHFKIETHENVVIDLNNETES